MTWNIQRKQVPMAIDVEVSQSVANSAPVELNGFLHGVAITTADTWTDNQATLHMEESVASGPKVVVFDGFTADPTDSSYLRFTNPIPVSGSYTFKLEMVSPEAADRAFNLILMVDKGA